jgi:hypothetical protein
MACSIHEMGMACNIHEMEEEVLVGKSREKRSVGCPRCTWEDNMKMDLRHIRWGGIWTEFFWPK